jgi:hypothetical protein
MNIIKTVILHTYHSRFIPVGIAEASQIFLRDAHDHQKAKKKMKGEKAKGGNLPQKNQSL